jgi:hypothetical protein
MSYTLQDCVTEVRGILQDAVATYRITDADMVIYGNGALNTIALHRPDLFSTIGDITIVAGTLQAAPTGSLRLMEVFRINGGRVVKECAQRDLDTFDVNWHSAATGPTQNWVRHPRDPNRFMISPPPDAGTVTAKLYGQWSVSPTALVIGDTLPIPDAYKPLIVEYMVWRCETRDDEYVNTARAGVFIDSFKSNLGVSARTKQTADSDGGNRDLQMAAAAARHQGIPAQQGNDGV